MRYVVCIAENEKPRKLIWGGLPSLVKQYVFSGAMMTSSNGNFFRVTGPLCEEFTGPGEFPAQRPVTRSFDVFFDPRLNKRLNKQPWGWCFETPSWSLWRHCNVQRNSFHPPISTVFIFAATSLTHRDRDTMAANFLTTFSNAFSWMRIYKFRLRFHWSLFSRVQLTIFQH